jgi:hypothetical protein
MLALTFKKASLYSIDPNHLKWTLNRLENLFLTDDVSDFRFCALKDAFVRNGHGGQWILPIHCSPLQIFFRDGGSTVARIDSYPRSFECSNSICKSHGNGFDEQRKRSRSRRAQVLDQSDIPSLCAQNPTHYLSIKHFPETQPSRPGHQLSLGYIE